MLDDLGVPLSTLELMEEQNYDQVCLLILVTKASDTSLGFNEVDDGLLRC